MKERSAEYSVERCFACGKSLVGSAYNTVYTSDGSMQYVGANCYRRVVRAGKEGYRPPKGGPRLFTKHVTM